MDRQRRPHRRDAIFDSVVDFAIVATDLDGRMTDWSAGAERLLGCPASEALGEDIALFFTPEDREEGRPGTEMRLAREEGRADDERWHIRQDGTRFWASSEMMPLREDGVHVGYVKILREITDRREADETLRAARAQVVASDDRYRALVDALEDGFCVFEMKFDEATGKAVDYRFVDVNEAFVAQTGLTGAVGRWMRTLAPAHEQAWFDRYGDVVRTDRPLRVEAEAAALGRYYDISAFRLGTPEAPLVGAIFRDISERRRADLDLRRSEERFRVFAEVVPNHVWSARPDGHLEWFNGRTYDYTGTPPGSLEGSENWVRMVHPDDVEALGERWTRSLSTGEVFDAEVRLRRADGTYRWFVGRGEPVRGEDGQIERWVGTNTDIDDRRRQAVELARLNVDLERQVAERTADRNALWQLSADIMLRCRFDGVIVATNPAWSEVLGWEEADLVGTNLFDLLHPDDLERTREGAAASSDGARLNRFENRYRHRDGSHRWISWSTRPAEGLINAVGRDVTVEKEQAEALARTEEALRQSQKMEAVGQLTGGLAHDFNNLLAGISGALELMAIRMAQGRFTELDRYMGAAQDASKRAAALTHRLLAFSRRQTLDPRPTDANRLVAGMEELVRRTVGPAITVDVVPAADLWATLVDPPQLENALLNLCINARDAMPDGGRLTVETANRSLDRRAAEKRDLPAGQYVSLCVSDTGTGMTPDVIAKAFDPFFTTKPLGQGTGLGLSMIYGFARQSGGQVRIHSQPGMGTTVCIFLPRRKVEAETSEASPKLADAPRSVDGETVLVVDDEPTVRMLVTEVLGELGYAAVEAADGLSGLKVLQSDARVDLLVTDVGLPGGMNGRQMADAARVSRPDLKVLFITGYAENAAVRGGHLAHGMEVLTKPFAMEALASRIRYMIASPRSPGTDDVDRLRIGSRLDGRRSAETSPPGRAEP